MKKLLCLAGSIVFAFTINAQTGNATKTDSIQIRNTITSFYEWYLNNHAKLNSFELYRGTKSNDTPPYKIDWKEAERYFAFIRSSVPQLGEEFIKNQRIFLKQCDSAFKKDLDGEVPYGFDYDWYTNSQEDASWLVDEIKKAEQWLINVNGLSANVELHTLKYSEHRTTYPFICYQMKKEKALNDKVGLGKWKIARIGCVSPDNEPPPVEVIKQ